MTVGFRMYHFRGVYFHGIIVFRVHYFRCVYFCVVTESVNVFRVHHFRCVCIFVLSLNQWMCVVCIILDAHIFALALNLWIYVQSASFQMCVFLCRHWISECAITLAKHVFLSPGNVLIQSAVHDTHTLPVFHGINAAGVCFGTSNSTCSKDVLDI